MAQISKHLKISDHISPLNDITFSSFLTFFYIKTIIDETGAM